MIHISFQWDGTSWSELGTGSNALNANDPIFAIALDHSGNLYAAGSFQDTNSKFYVAKWNGTTWSSLGALNSNTGFTSITIDYADNVYAAGYLINAEDGKNYVAKWNGTSWSELGTGSAELKQYNDVAISTIAVDNSQNVYAAGDILGTNGFRYVAKWTSGIITAITEQSNANGISLYPNPTNGLVNIILPEEGHINVYNSSGKLVITQQTNIGVSSIDLSIFTSGIYTLLFNGQSTSYAPLKVVKE